MLPSQYINGVALNNTAGFSNNYSDQESISARLLSQENIQNLRNDVQGNELLTSPSSSLSYNKQDTPKQYALSPNLNMVNQSNRIEGSQNESTHYLKRHQNFSRKKNYSNDNDDLIEFGFSSYKDHDNNHLNKQSIVPHRTNSLQNNTSDGKKSPSSWNLRSLLTATGILSAQPEGPEPGRCNSWHEPEARIMNRRAISSSDNIQYGNRPYCKLRDDNDSESDSHISKETYDVGDPFKMRRDNNLYYSNNPNAPNLNCCKNVRGRGSPYYYSRQRQFPVIEISDGRYKRLYMQTADLLRIVHCHNERHILEDTKIGSLKMRDLRQICSQSLGSQRASIEVRRNCILFNLIRVRCIIMHKKLILLPPSPINPTLSTHPSNGFTEKNHTYFELQNSYYEDDDSSLIKKLVNIPERPDHGPFEFAVLEALLVEVCSSLTVDLAPIVQEAERIKCAEVEYLSSTNRLHQISDLKRHVDAMTDRVRGISDALQELLDNEEDLRRLHISFFWDDPVTWENPIGSLDSEDVEILLECYEQEVESMLKQTTRIDEQLDDTLQMIQLHLASIRNAFLKSELGLDVVGTVITFIGALAGIFGMNIPNGFERNDGIFWPFAHSLIGVCIITAIITIAIFRRVKL